LKLFPLRSVYSFDFRLAGKLLLAPWGHLVYDSASRGVGTHTPARGRVPVFFMFSDGFVFLRSSLAILRRCRYAQTA